MRRFEIGVVLPLIPLGEDRGVSRWPAIWDLALRAEETGFHDLDAR